jgi:hypothetical protein
MADRDTPSRAWRRAGRLASRGAAAATVLAGTWALVRTRTAVVVARAVGRPHGEPGRTARGTPSFTPSAPSLAARYETKDLSARGLAIILATLATTAGALIGVAFGLVALFGHLDRARLPPLTAQQTARIVPPAPRLQTHPFADLARLREHEARLLNSYAWVDPRHQRARIPIRRAVQLAIGRSLDAPP